LDESVHEVTTDGPPPENVRQLGEVQQPGRVPRGPVGVVAVGDAIDRVVRLGGFVQELGETTLAIVRDDR
jgi:hypothetical protein